MTSARLFILVPIDLSDVTERVVETAARYAQALGGTLHLLHVAEPLPLLAPTDDLGMVPVIPPVAGQLQPDLGADVLSPWRERLASRGLAVEATELSGPVVPEINRLAVEIGAELIVLGSHGHGAMYELLVGSVAQGVLKRATCPVLIVPVANGRGGGADAKS